MISLFLCVSKHDRFPVIVDHVRNAKTDHRVEPKPGEKRPRSCGRVREKKRSLRATSLARLEIASVMSLFVLFIFVGFVVLGEVAGGLFDLLLIGFDIVDGIAEHVSDGIIPT
jgi:hypothetical protein